jgi:hypothetical protein
MTGESAETVLEGGNGRSPYTDTSDSSSSSRASVAVPYSQLYDIISNILARTLLMVSASKPVAETASAAVSRGMTKECSGIYGKREPMPLKLLDEN